MVPARRRRQARRARRGRRILPARRVLRRLLQRPRAHRRAVPRRLAAHRRLAARAARRQPRVREPQGLDGQDQWPARRTRRGGKRHPKARRREPGGREGLRQRYGQPVPVRVFHRRRRRRRPARRARAHAAALHGAVVLRPRARVRAAAERQGEPQGARRSRRGQPAQRLRGARNARAGGALRRVCRAVRARARGHRRRLLPARRRFHPGDEAAADVRRAPAHDEAHIARTHAPQDRGGGRRRFRARARGRSRQRLHADPGADSAHADAAGNLRGKRLARRRSGLQQSGAAEARSRDRRRPPGACPRSRGRSAFVREAAHRRGRRGNPAHGAWRRAVRAACRALRRRGLRSAETEAHRAVRPARGPALPHPRAADARRFVPLHRLPPHHLRRNVDAHLDGRRRSRVRGRSARTRALHGLRHRARGSGCPRDERLRRGEGLLRGNVRRARHRQHAAARPCRKRDRLRDHRGADRP